MQYNELNRFYANHYIKKIRADGPQHIRTFL